MPKLFLVITAALFVSGCVINSNNDLFAKKKDCAALRTEIEQRIKSRSDETGEAAQLNKIFYSPKRNTCMYTTEYHFITSSNANARIDDLYDSLADELVGSEMGCQPRGNCAKDLAGARRDFDKLVEKYE